MGLVVHAVDLGPELEEEFDDGAVARDDGEVERGVALVIPPVQQLWLPRQQALNTTEVVLFRAAPTGNIVCMEAYLVLKQR